LSAFFTAWLIRGGIFARRNQKKGGGGVAYSAENIKVSVFFTVFPEQILQILIIQYRSNRCVFGMVFAYVLLRCPDSKL